MILARLHVHGGVAVRNYKRLKENSWLPDLYVTHCTIFVMTVRICMSNMTYIWPLIFLARPYMRPSVCDV